jgi:hypothetical protein
MALGAYSADSTSGGFLVARMSFVLLWAIWENDWKRLRPATSSYTVLSLLQLFALARFRSLVQPGLATWAYLAFLIGIGLLGGYGVVAAQRSSSLT